MKRFCFSLSKYLRYNNHTVHGYDLLTNYPAFWNWNEATAAKVTHKKEEKDQYENFEEDYKSACEGEHLDFDEDWEKALFRICYINPKYQSKVNLI